ncbi:excisionase [Cytobacillus firmus DS1]|uniref:Excisionase n=2 Tax=Cytobacillus firmus TaxID=1399 RepID=W7KZG5_CYTFI|nr:excisionase [Cytobacillus firmus DS1]
MDLKKLIAKEHLKMQRKTLTAQEVAEYIGVHPDTIYTMVREKQIPHFRVRRRIFFSMETINAWMRDQEQKSLEAM